MAKTKTPAFSLSARKSIGSKLTFQKKGSLTMVRDTPKPSDPQTLLQMYQRWEVQDHIAYWQTLSDAQKLVYFRAGARHNRTPVAEFLKDMLTDLPDIVSRYRLDTITGSLALDSSKNAYNGTVFGPSLTDGVIDKALYFDGIDDYVRVPKADCIVNGDISIEAFIYFDPTSAAYDYIVSKKHDWVGSKFNYSFRLAFNPNYTNAALHFDWGDSTAQRLAFGTYHAWLPNTWYHVAVTHDGQNVIFYINGVHHRTLAKPYTLVGLNDYYFCIGCRATRNSGWWKGKIDNAVVYNRVLTEAEIYLRSQRTYPL